MDSPPTPTPAAEDAAPAAGAVRVVVAPDQVWPPPARPRPTGPPAARHSFFAPIALVTALSSALLAAALAGLALWLWLER